MTWRFIVFLCVACASQGRAGKTAESAAPSTTPAGGSTRTEPESLIRYVPSTAIAAVVVRRPLVDMPLQMFERNPELKAELGAYLTQVIGVDLTRIEGLVVFATALAPAPEGAALLRMRSPGQLRGNSKGTYQGFALVTIADGEPPLVAATLSDGVVLGTPGGVRTAIDLVRNVVPSLGSGAPLAALNRSPKAHALAALVPDQIPEAAIMGLARQFALRSAALDYQGDGLLTLRVSGERAGLQTLKSTIENHLAQSTQQLQSMKQQATQKGGLAEGVSGIFGYHQWRAIAREIQPRVEGDELIVQYRLPFADTSTYSLVAVAGIASAVAIPAFMKYVRRSKTTEATLNLRTIHDRADQYYLAHSKGKRQFRFPATTPWSPAMPCCQQSGSGGRCQPSPEAFAHPTWRTLGFAINEPHYYQYRFVSEGVGRRARFTVEARGDLNCNGIYSSYRRDATIGSHGELVHGDLVIERDLE